MQAKSFTSILRLSSFALGLALGLSASAATVITSAPYTITTSGDYELGNDINVSSAVGSIITINASNVTLDFKGHYIAGPVGNTSQNLNGVAADERSNLTIKNGTIAFCFVGISISGNGTANTNNVGHRIESMRITYCYFEAIRMSDAPGSKVSHNQISKIGGSTTFANAAASGFNVSGSGVTIEDNTVAFISPVGTGVGRCIYADDGVFVRRNDLSDSPVGVELGICQNNLVFNCPMPFVNTDDGGQNMSF